MPKQMETLMENKYLIIDNLLNEKQIMKILNGNFTYHDKLSSRRTLLREWKGLESLPTNLHYVVLKDGRIDINLPKMIYENFINENKILRHFNFESEGRIFKNEVSSFNATEGRIFKVVFVNLLINPEHNNKKQDFHQDNSSIPCDNYYTILIPLTDDENMGKTEIIVPYTYNFPKNQNVITPDIKIGSGLCFSGCLWHRGTPNKSNYPRICLYVIVSTTEDNLFENWV
jgi:hypothetical protein